MYIFYLFARLAVCIHRVPYLIKTIISDFVFERKIEDEGDYWLRWLSFRAPPVSECSAETAHSVAISR